ncbi:MAG: hypothetical protein ACRCSV_00215 [Chlamydiales bacterium]
MVTPSAPRLGSVEPSYVYPKFCDSDIEPLKKEERYELYTATDELLAGQGSLRKYLMDFCYGRTILTFESHINQEFYGTMLLDMVAAKFFSEHKEEIAQVNPPFSNYMESNILTKDLRKISDLFYRAFNRYLEDKTTEEDGLDNIVGSSTIANSKPGFKNFHRYCHYDNEHVTSSNILKGRAGECFKSFLESLPASLLTQKNKKKALPFLQEAVNQRRFLPDKLLYLKQVLFLLSFQDVFREGLLEIKQSLNMEKENLYRSPSRSHDLHSQSQYIYKRIELIDETLAKLPVNDVLALIPLACRSSLEELSHDRYFMNCYIKEESLSRECCKGRQADIAIRDVLEHAFKVTPKSFAGDGIRSIESYIMGLSGLAISSGLLGRLAMKDHHKIFYKRHADCSIPSVSDNLPLEFLVTSAQFYSATNDNWVEETHLGYLKEMTGAISPHEIEGLKYKLQRVRNAVKNAPVEQLLNGNTLGKDAIKNLQSLYKDVRKDIGLAPLPKSNSSACSIM